MRIIEHYLGLAAVLMRCITVGPKALDGGLHSCWRYKGMFFIIRLHRYPLRDT